MAKKEGIRKLFDNIAPDYDRLNHILSLNIDKGWSHLLWNSSCDAYVFPPDR